MICLVLITCLWLYYLWYQRKFYMLHLKVPGPIGYPLIGTLYKFFDLKEIIGVMTNFQMKYGNTVMGWLGPLPLVFTAEPQLLQDILTSPDCANKYMLYDTLEKTFGKGLLSSQGETWRTHRKLFNLAFSPKMLQSYVPIFNEESDALLQKFEEIAERGEHDLAKYTFTFSANTATQTTMNILPSDVKAKEILSQKLTKTLKCIESSTVNMIIEPWLRYKKIRRFLGKLKEFEAAHAELRNITTKLIDDKLLRESQAEEISLEEKNIFINLAIDAWQRNVFTFEDINGEVGNMLLGASATTARTVCNVMIMLAMFPEYQEKAFEEVSTYFPESGAFPVDINQLPDLVYLDMILNETLRLIATVPIIARQSSKDVRLSNGIVLPARIGLVMSVFHLHRRKDIWGADAETFNPDHFLPENLVDKHPYAYMPFLKGVRTCIGHKYAMLSMKIVLIKIIRNFRFTTDFKMNEFKFLFDVTMNLVEEPLLKIYKRH